MGKKKKIREEFNIVFKSGDQKLIKQMLDKYPWLLNEISQNMDQGILEQYQIVAALGVMEDELGGPVSIDQIMYSLGVDFNIRKEADDLKRILNDVEKLNLVKKESSGWILTDEGGIVCDSYLNKNLEEEEL